MTEGSASYAMKQYDTFIIGHLCIDEILDSAGEGDVLHRRCGWSTPPIPPWPAGTGVGILIKSAQREKMIPYVLPVRTEDIYWRESATGTTSIRNQFLDGQA